MTSAKKSSHFVSLLACFSPHIGLLVLAFCFTIIQVALTVYLPVLIGQSVDAILLPNNWAILLPLLLKMGLLVGVTSLMQWWSPLIYNRLIYKVVGQLRQDVLFKLQGLPFSYLDHQSKGDLLSRVTTDTDQLTTGLLMVFNQFFTGFLTILMTLFTMIRLDAFMALMVIGLTPLSLLLANSIAKKSYAFYRQQIQYRGLQTNMLSEALEQEDLIQQFNAQKAFSNDFKAITKSYSDASLKAIYYASTVNPITRFVNSLIYALLAGVGVFRIMAGVFSVGELTTFLSYANQYTRPFNDISTVFAELQSALACVERLFVILNQADLSREEGQPLDGEKIDGEIVFENVCFSYDKDRKVIQNLNLVIPPNSRVALVGPTGAGKSTLINLLLRFYEVDSGRILLDGLPVTHYNLDDFRQQIGLVMQETWLKPASIHDNIAYGKPQATREEVIRAAKKAKADFFINQLSEGYDTMLTDSDNGLSKGQIQLLSIARLFLKEPKLLILDEATSSIDTRTEGLVQTGFENLMKNKTSFIIAHRLSTIETADLILVMVAGEIVESGQHDQLMQAKGVYYQMRQAVEDPKETFTH